jgi:hypothetical protein
MKIREGYPPRLFYSLRSPEEMAQQRASDADEVLRAPMPAVVHRLAPRSADGIAPPVLAVDYPQTEPR